MSSLAVLSTGQTPRKDLISDLRAHWPANTEIHEYGALDGITGGELETLTPSPGEEPLTSRLADGSSIVFGANKIIPYLAAALCRGESAGAEATLLVCGSEFPELPHVKPLFRGSDLLHHGAASLCHGAKVGVIRPLQSQLADACRQWTQTLGRPLEAVAAAEPYDRVDMIAATAATELSQCDVVILDCFRYSKATAAAVARRSGCLTILTRTIVGRILGEVLSQ